MSVLAAQALWCEWPLAERLALLARWQARQGVALRAGLGLLPEQAPAATDTRQCALADGRRQVSGYGPLGVLQLQAEPSVSDARLLVHACWACALGNAVYLRTGGREDIAAAVSGLQALLKEADPALESLLQLGAADAAIPNVSQRTVMGMGLQCVVAPSADVPQLVKDSMHASRVSGLVLWVNQSLHHEITRRVPQYQTIKTADEPMPSLLAGDFYIGQCGSVIERLRQLQQLPDRRSALYSGDWSEVQSACELAAAQGASLSVNTVDPPPLGLTQAQSLYQRPFTTVLGRA